MHLKRLFLLLACCGLGSAAFAQSSQKSSKSNDGPNTQKESTINQLDEKGQRNGMWWIQQPAIRGEEAATEFGNYDHGLKLGPWYKISHMGDLMSIENFRFDVKNGEAKYFEQGHLVCVGNYRGLNPTHEYDTIAIIDPVTGAETLTAVPTERGSVRHGLWRFYDPITGRLTREEEYQIDELVYKKNFETTPSDSTYFQRREQAMPHNLPENKNDLPPKKKQVSYTNFKQDE